MAKTELTMAKRVALLEQEIAEMKALLKGQAAKSDTVPAKAMAAAAAVALSPTPATQPSKKAAPEKEEEGISPEVMAVISAAVTHFLGLRARIRHAHMIRPTGVNPWAQQGRVFIQASHNLAHR
jgi:hypothetical protein